MVRDPTGWAHQDVPDSVQDPYINMVSGFWTLANRIPSIPRLPLHVS